ncbi:rhodanese-like domain-containing protein [Desulfocucumis palustris]|uniref:rhodanese-like domain-containing protein n=1 Tax=Desulfocucumis palustris TaxID=1898651 RepID=UPI000CE9D44A|nr:rhodanese-like domain-containing protein [Desulfocucumis palustris]
MYNILLSAIFSILLLSPSSSTDIIMHINTNLDTHNRIIVSKELTDIIKNNRDNLYILDIRKSEDFQAGHIPGAINHLWNGIETTQKTLPKDKIIVVYCYTGKTANKLVEILSNQGYNVFSLEGGWLKGWIPFIYNTNCKHT